MWKETITYKDFFGEERTEDFRFHLSKAECAEKQMKYAGGGYAEFLKRIVAAKDPETIVELFKQFILDSYGEISSDGRRFVKSPELSKAFSETEAYSILYMKLATDDQFAAKFVNGVLPKPDEVKDIKK
jgi:hypothetical protein